MTHADLRAVWTLESEIARLKEEWRLADDSLKNFSAAVDGLPKGKAFDSKIERLTARKIDLERRIADLKEGIAESKAGLAERILTAELDTKIKEILLRRYVHCRPYSEIAAGIYLSVSRTMKLHKQGLKKICS